MNTSAARWLPLTGIVFVGLIVAGILTGGDTPSVSDSPEEIAAFYTDNKDRLRIGVQIFGIGLVVAVFFASYLRSVLDRGDGENGLLSRVAFAGIILFAIGGAIDATLLIAMIEIVDDVDPTQIQTLQGVWDNDYIPLAVGLSLFNLASGLSIVMHRSLPVWLGWLAIVIGIVAVSPVGFFAFLATGVWILIVRVMLLITEGRASTPVVE
jgi:hypothetical protein